MMLYHIWLKSQKLRVTYSQFYDYHIVQITQYGRLRLTITLEVPLILCNLSQTLQATRSSVIHVIFIVIAFHPHRILDI